ncbi:allantoicase [Sediminicurvatus halobius]|uniref:Probable allantoicase n=1 Tax=Sediminicurvatus halobius TaxID=2182432 RepID=A0A2U2MZW1_9GAMM|nr:allantoicase [Spiribacter halobius]PWG62337.1 allantoicase [Spiribacter halobius]UEX79740.1 allantoicase [Spiribacter halobius]
MTEAARHANPVERPDFARGLSNLADARAGATVVAVSDEFFAPGERMLAAAPPVFYPERFDDHGKWMDGWETRRRRGPGHDWAVVRLAMPGVIEAIELDTSFFTGNFPPAASVEACRVESGDPDAATVWQEIVPVVSLRGDDHRFCRVEAGEVFTHLRLNLYPDGGIARLRVHGRGRPRLAAAGGDVPDLAALGHGGRVVAVSDAHYGDPNAILAPGRGVNMGDGWETRRRREPGNDWGIIALGCPGRIERVVVDTAHFKGNFPARVSLQAARPENATDESLVPQSMFWETLLPEMPLQADAIHEFQTEQLVDVGVVSHVRCNLIPDGGISRLRLHGWPEGSG